MTLSDVRPGWDFDYAPIAQGGGDGVEPERDLIVATTDDLDPAHVAEVVGDMAPGVTVTSLFSSHPLFWTRVEASLAIDRVDLARRLANAGAIVRYVASAQRGSQRLPPSLDLSTARQRRPNDWKIRPATYAAEPDSPWRWFLRDPGIDVDRACCGTGAGTRLAVIDNDGRDLERIWLDAEVLVAGESIPRAQSHAALMLAWAVGTNAANGQPFRGVAPDAAPRFYCIPKPKDDVWSLPLAIVRATEDGADVIVCASYVEGTTSPLLDDALEFATRLGRGGRGTPVVMPTGREMSSPPGSTHCSLSLGLGEPASDPRVFCIGPSARDGGWFLWRDRRGKLRPFANRGPSVRWLAPGDDLAYPFALEERPWHAESSGAAGIASGALLLLLGKNPELSLEDIHTLFTETAVPVDPQHRSNDSELASRRDLEPAGIDRDGHNAKHGYGRLNATASCIAAQDPFAQALIRLGERRAAGAYLEFRRRDDVKLAYSEALGRWAARAILADRELLHGFCVLGRALRLAARRPDRSLEQPAGHLLRQLCIVLRLLVRRGPPPSLVHELDAIESTVRALLSSEHLHTTEASWAQAIGHALAWARPPETVPGSRSATVIALKGGSSSSSVGGGNLTG
jgi:hypothetical protein